MQASAKGSSPTTTGIIVSAAPLCVAVFSPIFGYYVSWTHPAHKHINCAHSSELRDLGCLCVWFQGLNQLGRGKVC